MRYCGSLIRAFQNQYSYFVKSPLSQVCVFLDTGRSKGELRRASCGTAEDPTEGATSRSKRHFFRAV
jgi:hypothetical protein